MARTLLTLLIYLLLFPAVFAQNLEAWSDDNKVLCPLGSVIETTVFIRNNSDAPITIQVKRTDEKLAKYQDSFFRLDGKTTASRINESQNSVTLQPHETYSGLVLVFSSGFKEGNAEVSYRIFNTHKKTESAAITLRYAVSADAPSDKLYVNEQISISFMYPNPAVQYGEFEYRMPDTATSKVKISIHNILGRPLGKFSLDPKETVLRIPFKDWEPGVYFYMLVLDDETVASKKFIVKR